MRAHVYLILVVLLVASCSSPEQGTTTKGPTTTAEALPESPTKPGVSPDAPLSYQIAERKMLNDALVLSVVTSKSLYELSTEKLASLATSRLHRACSRIRRGSPTGWAIQRCGDGRGRDPRPDRIDKVLRVASTISGLSQSSVILFPAARAVSTLQTS